MNRLAVKKCNALVHSRKGEILMYNIFVIHKTDTDSQSFDTDSVFVPITALMSYLHNRYRFRLSKMSKKVIYVIVIVRIKI